MDKLLEIRGLSIQFSHDRKIIKAVNGVNLDVYAGEILALVGESGSGKSVTALSIAGLLAGNARITGGQIIFQGRDLLRVSDKEIEGIRGKEISYIFQEAGASLNPVLPIGRQIQEGITLHQNVDNARARESAIELLRMVRLPDPESILNNYPHQLSGGMNQRVMIAMALSSHPKLLIADEPTTALDVTVEAEVIRMLLRLREELGFSILFITHNLALAERFAVRVAIMQQGSIVEEGRTADIFLRSSHSHTKELIKSVITL